MTNYSSHVIGSWYYSHWPFVFWQNMDEITSIDLLLTITLLRIASFTIIIFVYLLQRVTVKKMAPYQQSTLNLRFQD